MRFLKKKEILILIISIVILVFLNLFEKETRNFFYSLSQPFQRIFYSFGQRISDFFEMFSKTREIQEENKALWLENQGLKSQIAFLKELKKENEVLRESLDLGLQEDFQLLFSYIISRDPSQDFILIDKGASDGVLKGQVVITPQKALVGKIEKVSDNFSRVILITNKSSSFPAKIQPEDLVGIIKGQGNFTLFFDLIPQETEIQQGQEIVTVSLEGAFPKGIFVGQIDSITKSDLVPYQKAKIKPAFDLKNLEFIFVILSY